MKHTLQQKLTTDVRMTTELTQAIKLLQYSTSELYDYIKEQATDNPLIELEERGIPQPIRSAGSPFSSVAEHDPGMKETLVQQARMSFENADDRRLVLAIIEGLDDDGYLNEDVPAEPAAIERGIHLLQQIGPAGIGARNLRECLSLQLAYNYPEEKLARGIVENHLELLASRHWERIASALGTSVEEVKEAVGFIKTLNPKPGAGLANFQAQYVTPDIILESKDSRLSFYMNDRYLPSIRLNPEYMALAETDTETAAYLNDKYRRFEWLVKSIEQRRATITNIMQALLVKQEAFFKEGFLALKPLTLKDIAAEIGVHESTVSRATMNKTIQTPNGSFNLRLLFSPKLATAEGDGISQRTLQLMMKNLIDAEDKSKPLSDQKIADYLTKEKGVNIARRTIAKYREQLNIPPAYKRKL
jgi:RNA polymerase sigma-54 factor